TLPPSVSIYQGDWKLIRLFNQSESGADVHRLFDLSIDVGEQADSAAANPERLATMSARLDSFLRETEAVTPMLNPAWDPKKQQLANLGWRSHKNCELSQTDTFLRVKCTGPDPHFGVQLKEPLPPGEYSFVGRFLRTTRGAVEIRWAEQGVKPLYIRDRMAVSKAETEGWQTQTFLVKAERPITSFRIDPGVGAGEFKIKTWLIKNKSEEVRSWNFAK
ncbi:MAG: hypothetical protein AAF585_08075, partial [Verrucomicrobiota bacterium]